MKTKCSSFFLSTKTFLTTFFLVLFLSAFVSVSPLVSESYGGMPTPCLSPDCTGPDNDGDGCNSTGNGGTCDTNDADPNVCIDLAEPIGCDDCASGMYDPVNGGDIDDDGICDDVDNCPMTANNGQTDTDSDGVGDACDNCPDDMNAGQEDADADGVGDVCDDCEGDDASGDTDGDGVCDDIDNCPDDANGPDAGPNNQDDTDADGVGDVCDVCPGFDDTMDMDADGVPDGCDNCPMTSNAAQTDTDADMVGDACDMCPGFDDAMDMDTDGVPDACDNCPMDANPMQEDTDGDMIGNACDVCPDDDPDDSDGDGVCDSADECPGFDDAIDPDGDSIPTGCDNCPDDFNPSQADSDGDGLGDACDGNIEEILSVILGSNVGLDVDIVLQFLLDNQELLEDVFMCIEFSKPVDVGLVSLVNAVGQCAASLDNVGQSGEDDEGLENCDIVCDVPSLVNLAQLLIDACVEDDDNALAMVISIISATFPGELGTYILHIVLDECSEGCAISPRAGRAHTVENNFLFLLIPGFIFVRRAFMRFRRRKKK